MAGIGESLLQILPDQVRVLQGCEERELAFVNQEETVSADNKKSY
jgi:hypothetical protein